jgi:uncharacterized protein (DUF1499 family)
MILVVTDGWHHMERKIITMNVENLILMSLCIGLLLVGCAQNRTRSSGLRNGQLAPCPSSPNCVSSQSADEKHRIEPLSYDVSTSDVMAQLKEVINSMKRSRIITEEDNYLHSEFRSALFRFVDDVEFYLDNEENIIHVRSASRIGYHDFGVNRKRVELIRSKLAGN